jgi:hypothetical protein
MGQRDQDIVTGVAIDDKRTISDQQNRDNELVFQDLVPETAFLRSVFSVVKHCKGLYSILRSPFFR